jgi:hypothetical protein
MCCRRYLPPPIIGSDQIRSRIDPVPQKAVFQGIDLDPRHLTRILIESPLDLQQRFLRVIPALEVLSKEKPHWITFRERLWQSMRLKPDANQNDK